MRTFRLRSAMAIGTAVIVAAGLAVAAVSSDGLSVGARVLGSGSAWFAGRSGAVSLLDGATGARITRVRGAFTGPEAEVEQDGAAALVVDRAAGTVRRVDGATWDLSEPTKVGSPDDDQLSLHTRGGVAWVVAQRGTVVQQVDPRGPSLVGAPQTVPGAIAGAAVAGDGTLWLTS